MSDWLAFSATSPGDSTAAATVTTAIDCRGEDQAGGRPEQDQERVNRLRQVEIPDRADT